MFSSEIFRISVIYALTKVTFCAVKSVEAIDSNAMRCDDSFNLMKEAYYEDEWNSCVAHGMTSVALFQDYIAKIVECRDMCSHSSQYFSDLLLINYGTSLWHISCISKCRPGEPKYLKNFLTREPYDYIQICYYKVSIS